MSLNNFIYKWNLKNYFGILLLLGTLTFVSCEKVDKVEKDKGELSSLSERIILDTAFGINSAQKMDIYLPAGRTKSTKVVVLIHGGAWIEGDKSEMNGIKNQFRNKWPKAAVVNINYRLASNAKNIHHTEIMNDIKAAVNLIIANKNNFNVSDTLVMVGASAGAQLALLYTYAYNSGNYVHAVADFFGPSNLNDWEWYNSYNLFLGKNISELLTIYNGESWNTTLYSANSPLAVVNAQSKPTIIFHGTLDPIVPLYQSQLLKGKLNTLNVPYEYKEYLDFHGFNETNTSDAVERAVSFFKAHL